MSTSTTSPDLSFTKSQYGFAFATLFGMQAIGTALYLLVFVALWKKREKFSSHYYVYLVSIGINDIVYMAYFGTVGGTCVLAGQCPFSLDANHILNALVNWLTWYFELFSDVLVAADRLVAICFYASYDAITLKASVGVSLLLWALAFAAAMPTLVGFAPFSWQNSALNSVNDIDNDAAKTYLFADTVITFTCVALSLSLSAASLVYLGYRRMSNSSSSNGVPTGMQRAQRNLLIQSIVRVSLVTCVQITYMVLPSLSTFWLVWLSMTLGQLLPLSTAVMNVTINSLLREEIWHILGCHGAQVSPVQLHQMASPARAIPNHSREIVAVANSAPHATVAVRPAQMVEDID